MIHLFHPDGSLLYSYLISEQHKLYHQLQITYLLLSYSLSLSDLRKEEEDLGLGEIEGEERFFAKYKQ